MENMTTKGTLTASHIHSKTYVDTALGLKSNQPTTYTSVSTSPDTLRQPHRPPHHHIHALSCIDSLYVLYCTVGVGQNLGILLQKPSAEYIHSKERSSC